VIAVVVVLVVTQGGSTPSQVIPNSLITTFLPGEIKKVPNSCRAVPAAMLSAVLPGKATVAAPQALNGGADSQCDWTLDKKPVYRLLELDLHAYAPSGLASGNGSATFAALDAYDQAMRAKANPSKTSHAPKAQLTTPSGMGSAAFSAIQVFKVGGATTDVATVVVRYHNVLVTVVLNGLDHSNKGGYGPVSGAQLVTDAVSVARDAYARLH
jgi:hypothetical protein